MAGYEVSQDLAAGLVVCRINSPLSDGEAKALSVLMLRAVAQVRQQNGTIRMLFVNQTGSFAFSTGALRSLADEIQRRRVPGDRTAVVVANSRDKSAAKQSLTGDSQVFISEAAAMLWLDAWRYKAA